MIAIKRVYDPARPDDGYRVLVDRLWPRGMRRQALVMNEWAKAIAPSTELRTWYGHRAEYWPEFQLRYRLELTTADAVRELDRLRQIAADRHLTLLTATRHPAEHHATVLREILAE
jgi:uncharacterized protein YeaO (DUF488 family)